MGYSRRINSRIIAGAIRYQPIPGIFFGVSSVLSGPGRLLEVDKAPRLSISIVIWILSSDTETSAATPLGGGARKVLAK